LHAGYLRLQTHSEYVISKYVIALNTIIHLAQKIVPREFLLLSSRLPKNGTGRLDGCRRAQKLRMC
jgi:hypothetical protein